MGGVSGGQSCDNSQSVDRFSISLIEQFSKPDEDDCHWLNAVKIAEEIGYSFVTIAAVSKYTEALLWARTTMSPKWAEIYIRKGYIAFDPMIAHMKRSNEHIVFDSHAPLPEGVDNPQFLEFIEDCKNTGYGYFRGIPFNWPTQIVYRIVTFGLMTGESGLETPEMVEKANILAEMISTRIGAPSESIREGVMWPQKAMLSEREQALLECLAKGYKNDRIAERFGLAEVTVRKHLLSAREKLGASTREQALAIALQDGLLNL